MKPHLDVLNPVEKDNFLKLITSSRPGKITCHHRKIRSVSKAKQHLKEFCLNEMKKEQKTHSVL